MLKAWQWLRLAQKGEKGAAGTGVITTLFVSLVLIYVGFMFIAEFAPTIGNITYSQGGVAGTFFELGKWLIPLLAIVGLILYGTRHFLGGGGGGRGGGRGGSPKK